MIDSMDENFNKILKAYQKSNAFGNLLGMQLEHVEPGKVIYSMKLNADHLATPKAAHGGSIAALMDGLLGVTALSEVAQDKKVVATVEFKINYLNPGLLNHTMVAEGQTIQKGKRLITVQGKIIDRNTEKVIAIASGTFNSYPAEKAGIDI